MGSSRCSNHIEHEDERVSFPRQETLIERTNPDTVTLGVIGADQFSIGLDSLNISELAQMTKE